MTLSFNRNYHPISFNRILLKRLNMKTILNSECEFKTATEILENHYPEILKDLNNDDYVIQYEDYDAFCEIEHDHKIVGFYTLEQHEEVSILNEIYIMSDFRGKNIAFDHILNFFSIPNTAFLIRNPNQNMIQTLLKHDLAIDIGENIIFSALHFIASSDEIYKNSKTKKAYRNLSEKVLFSYSCYDNTLKCNIAHNTEDLVKRKATLIVITPRKNDIKQYGLRKKLKKITLKSLDDKMLVIYNAMEDVDEFLDKTYDHLVSLNSIDKIINEDTIENLSKNNDIDKNDLNRIRNSIKKSIDNGEINEIYTKIRLAYLLENPDKIENEANLKLLPDKCPFCENEILDFYSECPVCAFSLEKEISPDILNIDGDNKLYREVVEKANENKWDLDEIFDLQCMCGIFEFIMMSEMERFFEIETVDKSNKVKIGSVAEYGLKNGYLKECSYEDYLDLVENKFSKQDLKNEVEHYGLSEKLTKKGLIKEIKNNVTPDDFSIRYIETEKGRDLFENSEIIRFYLNYLRTFLFCEFKKFCDEQDCSLNEAGDKFIETEYKKGIEKKNWRVYKQLLKYNIEKTHNPKECLKLAIQMLIYDLNCDDLRDEMGLGYEMDTLMYMIQYLQNVNVDFYELFEEAYSEFKLKELKHKKEKTFDTFMDICGGNFLEQFNFK